jgi:hypothetical protein
MHAIRDNILNVMVPDSVGCGQAILPSTVFCFVLCDDILCGETWTSKCKMIILTLNKLFLLILQHYFEVMFA